MLKVLRRDIAWGPHNDYRPFQFWSTYSRGRALVSDTGTIDFGTFRRGTASRIWFLPAGNGPSGGIEMGAELRDFDTNAVLSTVYGNTMLISNTQDANQYYGYDLAVATADQDLYLRFFDNSVSQWFGIAPQSFFLE
jgi:hypothetical protein